MALEVTVSLPQFEDGAEVSVGNTLFINNTPVVLDDEGAARFEAQNGMTFEEYASTRESTFSYKWVPDVVEPVVVVETPKVEDKKKKLEEKQLELEGGDN